MTKKKYTLREQYMGEIKKLLQDKNYEINYDILRDLYTGEPIYTEFSKLVKDIEYYYKVYDVFDGVTFSRKRPGHEKQLMEIFATDVNNPFIEKEQITYRSDGEYDGIGHSTEIEFWEGEQ